MNLVVAALLGVVQGLTEFLPVSSSAHLILARAFFGWDAERFGIAFDVACHVGTLGAVVAYFRQDLTAMAGAIVPAVSGSSAAPARQVRLIVAGTLPIVLVGLTLGDYIEAHFRTPHVAAVTLAAGALLLLYAERRGRADRGEEALTPLQAIGLGFAQAAALVPGVSRSGATITLGLLFGLRREAAARFSFLLGVPAVVAAAAKEALELRQGISSDEAWLFAVGIASSAIVGYLTVKYFLRYLAGHRLNVFAYYRLGLAALATVWILARD